MLGWGLTLHTIAIIPVTTTSWQTGGVVDTRAAVPLRFLPGAVQSHPGTHFLPSHRSLLTAWPRTLNNNSNTHSTNTPPRPNHRPGHLRH